MKLLGTLGGENSFAYDVNNKGQVIGWSNTSTGERHAFLWTPESGMTDLGTLGGSSSEAHGINDEGQVVGVSENSVGERHAFLWESGSGMTDLGTLGGNRSNAFDINNQGQVVGQSRTQGNYEFYYVHAFLWDEEEGMIDLGTLGSPYSAALSINDHGQVVGESRNSSNEYHAVLWEADYEMTDLGKLNGNNTFARDINENGQITGWSQGSGFLWESGNMTEISALQVGNEINNNGQVSGWVNTSTDGFSPEAVLWHADHGALGLGSVANGTSLSFGINAKGQVAGWVQDNSGSLEAALWSTDQEDSTPPELNYTVRSTNLWPPNNKMKIAVSDISATDNLDDDPEVSIEVSSDENSNNHGNSNTDSDWDIVENEDHTFDVYLKAQRNGSGDGRIYQVAISATDASGNTNREVIDIIVKHDQRRNL